MYCTFSQVKPPFLVYLKRKQIFLHMVTSHHTHDEYQPSEDVILPCLPFKNEQQFIKRSLNNESVITPLLPLPHHRPAVFWFQVSHFFLLDYNAFFFKIKMIPSLLLIENLYFIYYWWPDTLTTHGVKDYKWMNVYIYKYKKFSK